MSMDTLVKAVNVKKYFVASKSIFGKTEYVKAVDDVSMEIERNSVVALVGESGSGKTTFGRILAGIMKPTQGNIFFKGVDIYRGKISRDLRHKIQMIFQNPDSSLNPRMRIMDIIGEAILEVEGRLSKDELLDRAVKALEDVNLHEDHLYKYPHELSGGEKQRVAIARALSVDPEFIVADEPVSALDISIRAQIINLLNDIQKKRKISILYIAHDLRTVWNLSDYVAVMYLGKIVEYGETEKVFRDVAHPYTATLLTSAPLLPKEFKKHELYPIGEPPSLINPPSGCRFHTRCPLAKDECKEIDMSLIEIENGHYTACPYFK